MSEWRPWEPCLENVEAARYELDDVEARFFTKQLADDRHPHVLCAVCGEKIAVCRCTADEMRAWLERERRLAERVVQPTPPRHLCSRARGVPR